MIKQIYFHLTEDDFILLEKYLRANDFLIISHRHVVNNRPLVLSSIIEKGYQKLFVKKELIGLLKYTPYTHGQESFVDTKKSLVIEFDESVFIAESKEFFRGRLHYTIHENSDDTNTPYQLFDKTSKQLLVWFKRNFKPFPHPSLKWTYASQKVIDLVFNENAKILLNQTPEARVYFDKQGIHTEELVLV